MVYASTYAEYNMDSVVKLTFCSKNKEKKKGFYDRLHLGLQITNEWLLWN